jgi:hypothetical protein
MSEVKDVGEKYAHLAGKWVDYSTRPWDSPVEGEEAFCDRCIVLIDDIISAAPVADSIDRITVKARVVLTLSPSDFQMKQVPIKDLFIVTGKINFRARWDDPRFSTVTFYSNRFGISDSATAMRALNQSVDSYTDAVMKMQTIIQDETK